MPFAPKSDAEIGFAPHTPVEHLLKRVQRRMRVRQLAQRAFGGMLVFSTLYGLLLLTGRLTGLFPEWFVPWSVAVVPVLSLLMAQLLPGRPGRTDAAHAIDRHQRTQDLFLTWALLEASPSEYKPLVDRDATLTAASVQPRVIIPFQWERPSLVSAGLLGVLLLGAFFLPTLDPFGKVAVARQGEETRKLLDETQKTNEFRKAQLAQKDIERENSEEVEQAIEALKLSLQQMQKGEQQENLNRLNVHQKEISEMYRKLNAGDLKSLFDKTQGNQKLGMLHDREMFRKWQEELQQGNSESLQQAARQLQDDLERLTKTTDPVEKSELQRQIQKKLKELSDFAEQKSGSRALSSALGRAMQQLDAARQQGLSQEALDALMESLELAQEEMELLAQSARDLKSLEEALEVIGNCKQCNSQDQLDGSLCSGGMTLQDYAEMYAQLTAAQHEGSGGAGNGIGSQSAGLNLGDEQELTGANIANEKSSSAIQKGKVLLSMKTSGLADQGNINLDDYKRVVGEIRQSLEDVIDQEEIPPGYVENIKKYFDTLERQGK